jgi:hypothetical protein
MPRVSVDRPDAASRAGPSSGRAPSFSTPDSIRTDTPRGDFDKPSTSRTGNGRNVSKPGSSSNNRPAQKPTITLSKPSRDGISRDLTKPGDTSSGAARPRNPSRSNNVDSVKPGPDKPAIERPASLSQNKPGLNKPGRDTLKPSFNKPNRNGASKPGERGSDPRVIDSFKPGQLKPDANAGQGKGSAGRKGDPEVVSGLRNRDVRDGKAPPRERVRVDRGFKGDGHRTVINDNRTIIRSNCGHGFCGGRSSCTYAYDYCRPANWCGNAWGYGGWGYGSGFSFSFGYFSDNWAIGVGYNNWFDDCNYYRPVYSCYPSYAYCPPRYYYRPYYCRPYYSLRYSYGCYYPRYAFYGSYYPAAYGSYWWLYDDDDHYDYDYSAYGSGYDAGFSSGYDYGKSADGGSSTHEPTWLAGGSVFGSDGAASSPEVPHADTTNGWDLLTNGDAREALRVFESERAANPGDGLPQIGLSLAAGLLARYDEASAAMRSALHDDPDAFAEVPLNQPIADQLQTLLAHYRNITREKPEDIDARFMSAAVRHLLGQDAMAYYSIDTAIKAGDADESAMILEALIERALHTDETDRGDISITAEPAATQPLDSTPAPATSSPRQF